MFKALVVSQSDEQPFKAEVTDIDQVIPIT